MDRLNCWYYLVDGSCALQSDSMTSLKNWRLVATCWCINCERRRVESGWWVNYCFNCLVVCETRRIWSNSNWSRCRTTLNTKSKLENGTCSLFVPNIRSCWRWMSCLCSHVELIICNCICKSTVKNDVPICSTLTWTSWNTWNSADCAWRRWDL